ncbi:VirC2 family conjugal transfer protein [Brucella sp. NBRC 12950]|uniref:VirC2 family conjugal transfer protein n=1 Tax=Brucella sp. NBRC 12950 TaxID=2994518 RepID=UPI0025539C47|nr:VirC2 family conjugal transfer protein [Brucella sp. NBRC 12950]
MGIRTPSKSVNEIRNLADLRSRNDNESAQTNERQNESKASYPLVAKGRDLSSASQLGVKSPPPPLTNGQPSEIERSPARTEQSKVQTPSASLDTQQQEPSASKPKRSVWRNTANSTNISKKNDRSSAFQDVYIDKIQVYVSAELPAPGVSDTYDLVSQHYSPQKALQMILRKALQDYDFVIENGKFSELAEIYPVDEVAHGFFVQTSRMMSKELYQIARTHFDPLGLESTRSFGRKLASAALATFFSHELKQTITLK